ncbi:hypothetical protein JWJ88_08615 [Paracoccus methylovorus]|uniref:Uncharacterized protein n=1 Tax=Paracoccus methylovorus TaxID=2812658 RepID=A0ABX7JEL3_9RHOB|nr:hypothetical protein [Paracoccus methylovorus]QRZ12671.1 hypothetical protein JWJ88_08615 [Paracoccus methylovorus]
MDTLAIGIVHEARAMDPALEAPAVLRGKGFLPTAEGEKPEGCEVRHG